MPRSMSLAPSSRITASVPSGTDQSSRARPPEAVSPDTPALAISTASPLALSACSSLRRKRLGRRQADSRRSANRRARRSSPGARPRSGRGSRSNSDGRKRGSAARKRLDQRRHNSHMSGAQRLAPPGEWHRKRRYDCMNDTSRGCRPRPARRIALSGVNLSLGRGAARVHILKDIDLHIGRGEAIGLVGPSGSGKSTLLMVMAGLERADTGSVVVAGETLRRARRGRAGALSRPQCRHRLPVLPSHPDHDRAGERRGAAGTRRRRRRASSAPRANSPRSAWPSGATIIRRSSPAASSSASRWRARWRPIRRSWSPTSRPAISTRPPAADHRPAVRRPRRARHHAGPGDARHRAGAALRPGRAAALRPDRARAAARGAARMNAPFRLRSAERGVSTLPRCRSASRCANCAAACAASTSSSPASRSA